MKTGDLIFSRTAWGSREAKAAIGIKISKSTLGSMAVAEEYWREKSSNYEDLSLAIDEVILFSQNMSPTVSGTVAREALKMLWESWKTGFSQLEEKILFRQIMVDIGTVFKDYSVVGRNQLRQQILKTVCNSIVESHE